MSTAKFNQWLNSDGTENYKCRAWVNFNGTGTVAIRASGNVSSITDNGTGDYTVNFTTAMVDANYGLSLNLSNSTYSSQTDNSVRTCNPRLGALLVGSLRIFTKFLNTSNNAAEDQDFVFASIFR